MNELFEGYPFLRVLHCESENGPKGFEVLTWRRVVSRIFRDGGRTLH